MLICFWLQREMLNCPPGWAGRKLQQISVYFTAYLAICLLWEHVWAGQVRFRLGQLKLPHNGIIYLCLCQAGKAVVEEGWGGSRQSGPCRGYCYVTLHYIALPCVALSYVLCPFATCMLTRRLSDMMKIMEQKMSLGMAKTCVSACVSDIHMGRIPPDYSVTVSLGPAHLCMGRTSSCCRPKMIY